MKVYFGAAISKQAEFEKEYAAIQASITNLGYELITAYDVLNDDYHKILRQTEEECVEYNNFWSKVVRQADIAVFEATFPSTVHIGTEIGILIERGKPVVCLYKDKNPVFTNGAHSSRLIKSSYSLENIKDTLEWALEEGEQWLQRRFTMNIPSDIDRFLSRVSEEKQTSRSDYIRGLIEKEM